jgi:hypothetical protein
MKKIITLNGRDGIGKTEQVRLLRSLSELHVTRVLKEYGDKWPTLSGSDEFNWWFERASFDEFLDVITDSLNKRHLDVSTEKITVHERGTKMFLAVCIATLATRLKKSVSEVREEVERQFLSRLSYRPEVESDILLVENPAYRDYIKKLNSHTALSRCPYSSDQREIYGQYQNHLRTAIRTCLSDAADIIEVDQPIVDIQNRVRKTVSALAGVELEKLCDHIQCLFCLGGMSESGKSMLGQNLHTMHGSYRLKLKYFSSGEFGDDFALAQEVLKFLHAHRHVAFASVESLHNLGLPIVFKKLLGNRAKVVFLDAPQEERAKRHMGLPGAEMSEFLKKDALKERRGALRVKAVADLVIDTSIGSPEATCDEVFGASK